MDELPKLRLDLCPAPLEQDDDDESVEVASYNGLTLCEGDVLGVLDDISTDEDEDASIDCNDIESVAPLPIDIKSDEYELSPTDQQIINNNELSSQRSNKSRSSYYKRRSGREHVHIPILSSLSNRKVRVCIVYHVFNMCISIIAGVALVIGLSIFVVAITASLREPQQSSSVASTVLGDENTNGEIGTLQEGDNGEDSTYGYFDDEILTTATTQKQFACLADVKECSDGSFVSRDENNDCEFEPCPEEEKKEEEVATVSSGGGRNCDGTLLRIDIETDNYGFETSWTLQKRNPNNNNRYEPLQLGPPLPTKYADNTKYIGVYCLSEPGRYKFTINDLFKDGMCCEFGTGSYIGYLDGVEAFSSPEDEEEEWEVRSHPFTIEAKEVEVEETPGQVKIGDEVCITNYIMDRHCIELGYNIDRPDQITLAEPESHSFHCLLDFPVCRNSGYVVLTNKNPATTNHCLGYRLANTTRIIQAGSAVGKKDDTCTTCTNTSASAPTKGYKATIKGTVIELGSGSDEDGNVSVDSIPLLGNIQVLDASVGCERTIVNPVCLPPIMNLGPF